MNSVIFLDIKKAFDTVNHDILLHKMKTYGISGPELEFFNSYLRNRVQYYYYYLFKILKNLFTKLHTLKRGAEV